MASLENVIYARVCGNPDMRTHTHTHTHTQYMHKQNAVATTIFLQSSSETEKFIFQFMKSFNLTLRPQMENYVHMGPLKALLLAVIRLASYGVG